MQAQGTTANHHGHTLEETVLRVFTRYGFRICKARDYHGEEGDILLRDVPYTSIYGHTGKTEFVALSTSRQMRIRIECKWQQSTGSVDEKFPYLYLNCIYAMPEPEIILLIDGGGYKQGALDWIRRAVQKRLFQETREKDIRVCNLGEFIAFINRRLDCGR